MFDIKPALFIFQCTCSLATACLFYHIVFSLSRLFLKFFEKVFNFFSTRTLLFSVFFSHLNWRLDYYTLYYPFCQHFFSTFLFFFLLHYILWITFCHIYYSCYKSKKICRLPSAYFILILFFFFFLFFENHLKQINTDYHIFGKRINYNRLNRILFIIHYCNALLEVKFQ